ncbi:MULTISPECIES: DUF6415 family natural product biosynthesis protein [unclassified Streptomyces]|uniref:DUF6415 family natural product biosynthesis protein n=1 Tax=unclassified Streptomyces TaxID=2593676 RepID=UPI003408CD1D
MIDQQTAISQWLASAHTTPSAAWLEWAQGGAAMLPCGGIFDAVRISAEIVHAAMQSGHPEVVGPHLERMLDGPVIHDAYARSVSYYALVPPGTCTQHDTRDVQHLARGTYLGVPDLPRTARPGIYWLLPPRGVGDLCTPEGVGRLIRLGTQRIANPRSAPGLDLGDIERGCRALLTGTTTRAHDLDAAAEATARAHGYLMLALPALHDAAARMPSDAPARSRVLLAITEAHRQLGQVREENTPVRQYVHARNLAECCRDVVQLLRELEASPDGPTSVVVGR